MAKAVLVKRVWGRKNRQKCFQLCFTEDFFEALMKASRDRKYTAKIEQGKLRWVRTFLACNNKSRWHKNLKNYPSHSIHNEICLLCNYISSEYIKQSGDLRILLQYSVENRGFVKTYVYRIPVVMF